MTDLTEMVEWLRGVVVGDLTKAKAIAEECQHWRVDTDGNVRPTGLDAYIAVGPWNGGIDDEYATHIVRHDPRDTIARCEAELTIIDDYGLMLSAIELPPRSSEDCTPDKYIVEPFIRSLAYGYRRRPGWKEGWAP